MKIRLILIGVLASLALPLAVADSRTVLDPGLSQAVAGSNLDRGAAQTAENFGRKEDDEKGDNHDHCDKGNNRDHNGHCDCGEHGDHGDECEKSPSKPR